jgi:hypothetical protein
MKNSKSIINKIAQELDCGFDCYYNSKTGEVIGIPNFAQMSDEETFNEAFGADLKKIETQKDEFIKFEVLESFESFKIMERFVEQISDKKLQSELENVLANKKPFQNFKYLIDHSDFRQDWFDFKLKELEKIVESQLIR